MTSLLPFTPEQLREYLSTRVLVTPNGCHLWLLNTSGNGRGGNYPRCCLSRGGRDTWYAVHRLVVATLVGPIPAGMHVHHICATLPEADPWVQRLCVCEHHLRVVTQSENELYKGPGLRIRRAKSLG